MSKITNKKTVHIDCSYCDGYDKQILADDDLAVVEGTMSDFEIRCPVSKKYRKICDKCIRMVNLEDKIIMLCDHLLDSRQAKAQRISDHLSNLNQKK